MSKSSITENYYFPLSIARGKAFCNRVSEKKTLENQIIQKRPTLLVSPRRYGKTSLVLNVANKMKLPYAQIDFFSAVDEQDIERLILNGITQLILNIEKTPKKAIMLAKKLFKDTHVSISTASFNLSASFNKKSERAHYRILDILESLETLAKKIKKTVILFFDEFQCINDATRNHSIESVLRQVAQETRHIAFIFSGSNRRLLNDLFDNRNKPFYKLCDKLILQRISEKAYTNHLQEAAQEQWGKSLSTRMLDAIYDLTKCHPYYVNLLCSRIWTYNYPTTSTIQHIWQQYKLEERSSVAAELELLSGNQKKLLTILSREKDISEPLGMDFVSKSGMSKASIAQAMKFLEIRDYIYRDDKNNLRVLDPLIESILTLTTEY